MDREKNRTMGLPKEEIYEKHSVTTLYIIDSLKKHVLLIKHKKLGVWLPPGGHITKGEKPHKAALREAIEETVIRDVSFLNIVAGDLKLEADEQRQLLVPLNEQQYLSHPTPFALVEELIPRTDREIEHVHIDHVYVAQVNFEQNVQISGDEALDFQWALLDTEVIEQLETFPNIKAILRRLKEIFS